MQTTTGWLRVAIGFLLGAACVLTLDYLVWASPQGQRRDRAEEIVERWRIEEGDMGQIAIPLSMKGRRAVVTLMRGKNTQDLLLLGVTTESGVIFSYEAMDNSAGPRANYSSGSEKGKVWIDRNCDGMFDERMDTSGSTAAFEIAVDGQWLKASLSEHIAKTDRGSFVFDQASGKWTLQPVR